VIRTGSTTGALVHKDTLPVALPSRSCRGGDAEVTRSMGRVEGEEA
jgi:hypothetical protein